ncbi:MAG: hypothetical protein DWQ18_01910 [Crenarchaeota archaeon]|nr:MAG: hypothetical protein DWQ17_06620 [Thermoproteota archaeon]RDJ33705.1 MAG: hypothetical protein DWQ18_01910 [Thermoproteota archaeon]RDJ37285.1 MAG: hypothetical protein DWQ19_02120 [Thermoproteota archaeon]RDJ39239.1 MAG: hypothetical protein DWQ13_03010 [Thermoproteota archaeon]
MDEKKLLEMITHNNFPVGIGGCKYHDFSYDCCEYNVTIFDDLNQDSSVIQLDDDLIKIQHGTLLESNSNILVQFDSMKIILDEKWELKMLLSKIHENKNKFFDDYAKSCLIESLFCTSKAKEGIKNNDGFASCWIKSSAYYLADAISLLNMTRPCPTHLLSLSRSFKKNKINSHLLTVTQCIGVERATPSLLLRMLKSTIGFSEMIGKTNDSEIIKSKYEFLLKNSLLSDCYFYFGYLNRNNFVSIKNTLHRHPEYIHVLKTAFDIENDKTIISQQIDSLQNASKEILSGLNQ